MALPKLAVRKIVQKIREGEDPATAVREVTSVSLTEDELKELMEFAEEARVLAERIRQWVFAVAERKVRHRWLMMRLLEAQIYLGSAANLLKAGNAPRSATTPPTPGAPEGGSSESLLEGEDELID